VFSLPNSIHMPGRGPSPANHSFQITQCCQETYLCCICLCALSAQRSAPGSGTRSLGSDIASHLSCPYLYRVPRALLSLPARSSRWNPRLSMDQCPLASKPPCIISKGNQAGDTPNLIAESKRESASGFHAPRGREVSQPLGSLATGHQERTCGSSASRTFSPLPPF